MSDSPVKGFNDYFVATNSPASESRREYGAYEFSTQTYGNSVGGRAIQDLSITNAKIGTAAIGTANIGTLTFNEISGGTAVLGGTSNGDGVLSINNAAGSEIVRADSTGLTVRNGSISIQNSSGSNSIDSSGVISSQNFFESVAQLAGGGTQEITSYSLTDINGASFTIVNDRERLITVNFMSMFWVYSGDTYGTNNYRGFARHSFDVSGTTSGYAPLVEAGMINSGGTNSRAYGAYGVSSVSYNSVFYLGAGTQTIKMQASLDQSGVSSGSPVLRIFGWRMNYILLGT